MLQKQLEGGWGVMVVGLMVALLAWLELSAAQWRALVVLGLLATMVMLYHKRLRHFILLPSCLAFASGLLLILMHVKVVNE